MPKSLAKLIFIAPHSFSGKRFLLFKNTEFLCALCGLCGEKVL
jgi:hypothetical protein